MQTRPLDLPGLANCMVLVRVVQWECLEYFLCGKQYICMCVCVVEQIYFALFGGMDDTGNGLGSWEWCSKKYCVLKKGKWSCLYLRRQKV